jgi:hypothetical protein
VAVAGSAAAGTEVAIVWSAGAGRSASNAAAIAASPLLPGPASAAQMISLSGSMATCPL